jgi:hypothetical protein
VPSPLGPLLLLTLVVVSDIWVYIDATRSSVAGIPVRWRIGNLVIDTPTGWLVSCIVLWVVCFPAYLVSRKN